MGEISVRAAQGVGLFRSRPGYILAILLAGLLVSAMACPRDPKNLSATEMTYLAAVQSLVRDLDYQFGDPDRERLGEFSLSAEDLRLGPSSSAEGLRYEVPMLQ